MSTITLRPSDRFPRRLNVNVSAGGYVYAHMFTEGADAVPARSLAFVSATKLDDCRIVEDDGDQSACLWLGSTAFDMSLEDAATVAARLNIELRKAERFAPAAQAVQS